MNGPATGVAELDRAEPGIKTSTSLLSQIPASALHRKVDLTNLSDEELIALKREATKEMLSCEST